MTSDLYSAVFRIFDESEKPSGETTLTFSTALRMEVGSFIGCAMQISFTKNKQLKISSVGFMGMASYRNIFVFRQV